ncbi:MAG TPA: hypothetical protein VN253_22070 [Kofleriaceae bacterium]|nr:hypothetical protein [Kofleriaceae bacterium]
MKTLISLSMLFAVTVAGCTSDTPGDGGDGGGDDGGGAPQPVPATPEGRYAMRSELDLATNIPGTAGTVATYFIQATDDPEDPTLFIVQKVTEALPNGSIKNALQSATPFVAGYLNDRLLEVAPTFVTKVIDLGNGFGQVAKNFGMVEELAVDAAGGATKTIKGLHFEIDGTEHELAFADYGIAETRVDGLTVSLAKNGQLEISEHKVPMKYGQIMRLALDQAIIPMIDPASSNLGELFHAAVNCTKVGKYIYDAIGFGSASTFESACNAGLTSGATALYNLMNNIDTAALELGIAGTARGIDKNRDGKMDEIVTGTWTGKVSYAGTPAPLSTAKFFGARM